MNVPKPPTIPPSGNFSDLASNSAGGAISSATGNVGFFGTTPITQQSGVPTKDKNNQSTVDSDHDMLLNIINILNNYGLISYSQVYSGRTFTFYNLTTNSPALELYITVGGPGNMLTSLGVFDGTGPGSAIVYNIPTTIGWTGNFQVWPVGLLPTNELGATLFEISVNDQVYNAENQLLPLRDNWDISTVSPYLPVPQLDCGPREQAVSVSYAPITAYGSGYFPGNNLSVTGGSGTGLKVDLVSVQAGALTYPTCVPPYNTPGVGGYIISDFGTGYESGDVLTIVQEAAVDLLTAGTGYSTGTNVSTTGGSGTGFTVDILEVSSGLVTKIGVNNPGSSYVVGDTLTITGGGANATFSITSVTEASGGQLTVGILTLNQCQSYNVGIQVIPPAPPTDTATYPPLQVPGPYWPPITVIANSLDGNCPQAITYPNDTALPKSQVGYAQGNYVINIVDPTVVVDA